MRLLGYTRVSTTNQDARLQLDALTVALVETRDVFSDVTSGSRRAPTVALDAADDYDDVNEALVAQAHASDAFLVERTLTGDAPDCKGWGSACPARDPSRDSGGACWVQEHDR